VLRYGPTAALDRQIDGALRAGQGYEPIARIPADNAWGPGSYHVWRSTAPRVGGP
jgi:hypothetical protein